MIYLKITKKLTQRKSFEQICAESGARGLKKSLGALHLTQLGIGCIVGAGIYVMTGNAAAHYAGPAVILSFLLASLACTFSGLCYSELASSMPVAGSAYTYAYSTMGEMAAWIMGWLLLLEYGVSAAAVASGWSGNLTSLLADFGLHVPAVLSTPLLAGPGLKLDLFGAGGILVATLLLTLDISESARVNNIIVIVKVCVLLLFVAAGVPHINIANWHPLIPHNEGGFKYGWPGVFRGASVIFFAYIGFEAVSTAAAEAKNPQRDIPVGILGSLAICTVLYILVAAVLTGIVPFRELGGSAPISLAVDRIGIPWIALLIKVGAFAGLSSVILVLLFGQSRIFFAMSCDGLIPPIFARLHERRRTPWVGTLLLGAIMAVVAATLPLDILGDLISLGTATAFAMVCASVLYMRKTMPDLPRPFVAPGGVFTPLMGIGLSVVMVAPLLIDVGHKAFTGDIIPAAIIFGYMMTGLLVYFAYGMHHSKDIAEAERARVAVII